jgi:hypothetical protein
VNDTSEDPDSRDGASTFIPAPDRHAGQPVGSRINVGRIGLALSLVPFAAITFGASIGLP